MNGPTQTQQFRANFTCPVPSCAVHYSLFYLFSIIVTMTKMHTTAFHSCLPLTFKFRRHTVTNYNRNWTMAGRELLLQYCSHPQRCRQVVRDQPGKYRVTDSEKQRADKLMTCTLLLAGELAEQLVTAVCQKHPPENEFHLKHNIPTASQFQMQPDTKVHVLATYSVIAK